MDWELTNPALDLIGENLARPIEVRSSIVVVRPTPAEAPAVVVPKETTLTASPKEAAIASFIDRSILAMCVGRT
jgi:hypothetical protein